MADPIRYYAFGERIGRMRIPVDFNEDEAIVWARARGAVNVQREDGPVRNPTVTLVWRESQPTAYQRHADLYDILATAFPRATVRETSEAAAAVEKWIEENNP